MTAASRARTRLAIEMLHVLEPELFLLTQEITDIEGRLGTIDELPDDFTSARSLAHHYINRLQYYLLMHGLEAGRFELVVHGLSVLQALPGIFVFRVPCGRRFRVKSVQDLPCVLWAIDRLSTRNTETRIGFLAYLGWPDIEVHPNGVLVPWLAPPPSRSLIPWAAA